MEEKTESNKNIFLRFLQMKNRSNANYVPSSLHNALILKNMKWFIQVNAIIKYTHKMWVCVSSGASHLTQNLFFTKRIRHEFFDDCVSFPKFTENQQFLFKFHLQKNCSLNFNNIFLINDVDTWNKNLKNFF